MCELPKISIITVCFNIVKARRKTVFRQMLDSVAQQSYRNIEHIIVDGASTDGSIDFIKDLIAGRDNVLFHSEPDSGIYDAMNRGAQLASGDYIAYVNTDDFYSDLDGVSRVVQALVEMKADFSYAPTSSVSLEPGAQPRVVRPCIGEFLTCVPFSHLALFLRNSVFEKEGGFDQSLKLAADFDLMQRLLLKGYKPAYVEECFAVFREGGASSDEGGDDYAREQGLAMCKNLSPYFSYSEERWVQCSLASNKAGRSPFWMKLRMLFVVPAFLRLPMFRRMVPRFHLKKLKHLLYC